jgi:acyl carrier protein
MDALTLIADIVKQPLPATTSTTLLQDIPGWDSLKMVQLVLRLEKSLGRELEESEMETLATIQDVDTLLRAA